jgi:glycosyltransferase involved in cell wall biosynthesis
LNVLRHLAENNVTVVLLVGDLEDTVACIPGLSTRPFFAPVHLPRLYHVSTVILLPYQPDLPHGDAISPLKLFEAMAAGRPIIASNLPSIREIVDHGRTGLLVPPTDLVAWERAIEKLRANPALAIELASNARRAVEQFSWRSRAAGIATCVGWLRPRP